ncbi:MAG: transposase [Pseudomonadota bacterium]
MTIARREVVVAGAEGFYHCISRCVRQAFLCGQDPYTGKSYDHRKAWVESRLKLISQAFAVEVCAFAVMSNHLHVVLRIRPDWAESWSAAEVARRWLLVFPRSSDETGNPVVPPEGAIATLARQEAKIEILKGRLASVSWFMRCLNESIARRANREDGCKGRFWEGRFKCLSLLDEAALLACMAYVDLNPVRAGIAASPEESLHTSAFLRINAWKTRLALRTESTRGAELPTGLLEPNRHDRRPCRSQQPMKMPFGHFHTNLTENGWRFDDDDSWLARFDDGAQGREVGIPAIGFHQYLELLDWTGRGLREKAPGAVPGRLEPILTTLQIDKGNWLETVEGFGRLFFRAAGKASLMMEEASRTGFKWLKGLGASRWAFGKVN